MRDLTYLEKFRADIGQIKNNGIDDEIKGYKISVCNRNFKVICSVDGDYEHVSVSHKSKTPSWQEMVAIKNLFFEDEEEVVQFHPPKSEYVNYHENCLHLWRRTDGTRY